MSAIYFDSASEIWTAAVVKTKVLSLWIHFSLSTSKKTVMSKEHRHAAFTASNIFIPVPKVTVERLAKLAVPAQPFLHSLPCFPSPVSVQFPKEMWCVTCRLWYLAHH